MNTPETFVKLFEEGIPMLTKTMQAVPEDKLDWKPSEGEGSRTIRQLFTEIVMMTGYMAKALDERSVPPYEAMSTEYKAMTIADLMRQLPLNAEDLYTALRAFPESEYENTLEAPWGVWTYFQSMSYPYWNLMWHTGQINYIQTLYGDQNFY
jgi:hypothetical protein